MTLHALRTTTVALDWHLAIALVAAVAAGFLRGLVGFGSALVLVPALAAVYGPATAVPVAVVLQFVLVATFVPRALPLVDRSRVTLLAVASLLPVPAGAWLLLNTDPNAVRWAVSAIVIAATAVLALGWRYRGRPHAAATAVTGAVSGLLAGATGLAGPPVVFFYLSGRDPAATIRASLVVFFAWVDLVALVSFAVNSALTTALASIVAVLIVPYAASAGIGAWLFGRASERAYRCVALGLLVAVAVASVPI